MADKDSKAVASTQSLDEMLGRWREEVKGKQRRVFSFEDRFEMKLKELKPFIYKKMVLADEWKMRQAYFKKVGQYEYIDEDFKPIKVGETWGGNDVSCFFKQTVIIPESMKGEKVILMVYFGGDSLLSINGVPYQGMDPFRNEVLLTECAEGGEVFDIDVEGYYMWHFGESEIKRLECSYIVSVDRDVEKIYWDYKAAFKGLTITNISDELKDYFTCVLKEAMLYLKTDATSREELLENLHAGENVLKEKIYACDKFKLHGKMNLIGNSHLDVVFLWSYDEFVRKLGRTHATMLRLMEQYPKFVFTQSQPLMYKEMKVNFPDLYEQVKKRIIEGRWEVIGGMWVEPDCNLISGESMTRQILFGKRFYEKEFGITTRTCWLPDVFGNCYTMPQILKKSGLDFFLTHKMGVWNDTNPWTQNSFIWEGPDGSRVFASMPPTHFIGTMEPDYLSLNWNRSSDKQTVGESIFTYGWGDGGGGVDAEMLEYVKRYESFPGLPETEPVRAEDALERMSLKSCELPVWKDELFLEAHRGVHTTKGRLKKLNRKCENLYREAEIYSVIASSVTGVYPQEKLNEGWEKLLTSQFHDSLPGSHIHKVYLDLLEEYKGIIEIGESVRTEALQVISSQISVSSRDNAKAITVFNSLPFISSRLAFIEYDNQSISVEDQAGNQIPMQVMQCLDGTKKWVFYAEDVPAVGYRTYYVRTREENNIKNAGFVLSADKMENDFYCVSFNKHGEMASIYDKTSDREVLSAGKTGNSFKLYEDIPSKYEAWDIVESYLDKEFPVEDGCIEVCDNGPVFCSVVLSKKLNNSTLRQKIILYKNIARIDFETEIDWAEKKKLLKVFFDVDVMAKDYTCDIAYGNIQRPAYRTNSYDKAKFEVSAHNWIDLSEQDYGVGILNDCKYGFSVKENKMSITLLKAPTNPDPLSDMEIHHFTYSLLPHKGTWQVAGINEKGLEFNNPLTVMWIGQSNGTWPSQHSFISIKDPNVTLEAVKKAEDSNEILIRVVERFGKRTKTELSLYCPISGIAECDLMEKETGRLQTTAGGKSFSFEIKPYEIKTFNLLLQEVPLLKSTLLAIARRLGGR